MLLDVEIRGVMLFDEFSLKKIVKYQMRKLEQQYYTQGTVKPDHNKKLEYKEQMIPIGKPKWTEWDDIPIESGE
jgi:hypothetical protein